MKWTEAELKRLLAAGKIRGYKVMNEKSVLPASMQRKEAPQVTWIRIQLQLIEQVMKYTLSEEFKFHPKRKWRFDFCFEELKLAIEYEGIQSQKSRHTTLKGYSGDSEKYNEAQRLGWRVFRYTILNYKNVAIDVKNVIHNRIISDKND